MRQARLARFGGGYSGGAGGGVGVGVGGGGGGGPAPAPAFTPPPLVCPATARAVELRNVSFCCFEVVLVGRFCILLGFGVAGMLLIIVELCHVRCSCAFFLANRRSGSLE